MQRYKPLTFFLMLLAAYLMYRWIESILFPRDRKPFLNFAIEHINRPVPAQNEKIIVRSNTQSVRKYDNVKQMDISYPNVYEIQAGTVHSYSYVVYNADCDITIDQTKLTYADSDFGDDTATETIKQRVLFEPKEGCTVRIKTIF